MAEATGTDRPVAALLGATGFVGTHVAAALETAGYRVLALARNRPPALPGRDAAVLDVAEAAPERIAEVLAGAGARLVVNATGSWSAAPGTNEYTYVRLVERLLAGTALLSEPPRLVHIGTIHEYGPVPHGTAIDESRAPAPETPYGLAKLAGSRAVLRATQEGRARGVVLRAVNVLGPGIAPGSFLGSVVHRLRALPPGGRLPLDVSDAVRDFVDVRDLAEAVALAAERPVVGQVVNIGRGEVLTMREVLPLLVAEAGLPADVLEMRDGDVVSKGGDWTCADIRRAARLLEWAPRTALRRSLRDMWEAVEGPAPEPAGAGRTANRPSERRNR